jgi:hypothetical protein
MRYLMLGRLDETKPDAFSPSPEMFAAVQKLGEEMQAAGALVETHGLLPSSTGSRVRSELGTRSVRTGPFDEGIGAISNFAIVEAASPEEATAWAAKFADCVGQEIEVRQLMG